MKMAPLIDQLQQETGLEVQRFETWHNEENAKKLQEYDKGECGGVPYFINTETNEAICGEADFETLKNWATKKNEV
jgi:hypothetical protein